MKLLDLVRYHKEYANLYKCLCINRPRTIPSSIPPLLQARNCKSIHVSILLSIYQFIFTPSFSVPLMYAPRGCILYVQFISCVKTASSLRACTKMVNSLDPTFEKGPAMFVCTLGQKTSNQLSIAAAVSRKRK